MGYLMLLQSNKIAITSVAIHVISYNLPNLTVVLDCETLYQKVDKLASLVRPSLRVTIDFG